MSIPVIILFLVFYSLTSYVVKKTSLKITQQNKYEKMANRNRNSKFSSLTLPTILHRQL